MFTTYNLCKLNLRQFRDYAVKGRVIFPWCSVTRKLYSCKEMHEWFSTLELRIRQNKKIDFKGGPLSLQIILKIFGTTGQMSYWLLLVTGTINYIVEYSM